MQGDTGRGAGQVGTVEGEAADEGAACGDEAEGAVMTRITVKDLEALRDLMALELGRPNGPTYTREGDRNVALVGKLIINRGSALNGLGWGLSEMTKEGGESSILSAGSARELFSLMHAYRSGFRDGREAQS